MLPQRLTITTLTFSFSITIILVFFVYSSSSSSSSSLSSLPFCNHTYSCGHLTNITYPFSGGFRPSYCGLPGFQLTCLDNSTSFITINSLKYQVLQLNQADQSLILSRSDLNNTICTNQLVNTTFDNTLFSVESNNQVLSLFYGCNDSVLPDKPPNLFLCEVYGKKDGYFWVGAVPDDPITQMFGCSVTLTVPVLESSAPVLESNGSLLGEVLRKGFDAKFYNPYANDCFKCYTSGGHCGFDLSVGRPLCICSEDQPCLAGSKSRPVTVGVGVGIGAAIVGIGLGKRSNVNTMRKILR